MHILIPVRYPLTEVNKRAIERGIELADGRADSEIVIFYLNGVQKDSRVGRKLLREAVESSFEGLDASYVVRDGFLIEEAIVEAAIQLEMDYIILSTDRRDRWKQLLGAILDVDQNPEQFVRDNTGIEVEVITKTESDSTNR